MTSNIRKMNVVAQTPYEKHDAMENVVPLFIR